MIYIVVYNYLKINYNYVFRSGESVTSYNSVSCKYNNFLTTIGISAMLLFT